MKSRVRARTFSKAGLLMVLLLPPAPPGLRAQEKGPDLSPETRAILGPESSSSLDPNVIAILGRPEGASPGEAGVIERSADIASKLRCPVCQGVSIADSPSGMATKMRGQVRDLVAKGYSEEQVLSYFERSYGEFVRLEPPLRGLNVMLWILPGLVLLGGGWFVFRKASAGPTPVAVGPGEAEKGAAEVDPELAKYLERIRRDSGTST
jgi:cytochrome c-type biogenesis protein CcmH